MSSRGSGRIRVESLTHSRHCTMPESGCAWGRMRRLRRSTRGWRYRPLCSARKAQTANRSSRSNAWMRAPRWRLPQQSAATALSPEIQPTWCSWTATRMLSPRRRRCGDAGGGDHARRPLDVLLFARRMIPDKERMRIPHTNPIGNRPLRRQGVRRHTAMTYR